MRSMLDAQRRQAPIPILLQSLAESLLSQFPCPGVSACVIEFDGSTHAAGCPEGETVCWRETFVAGKLRGSITVHGTPTHDGECVTVQARLQALLGKLSGGLVCVLEARMVQEALRREKELSRAVAEVSHALIGPADSVEDLCRTVMGAACRLTGSPEGLVAYVDEQTGEAVGLMFSARPTAEAGRAGPVQFSRGEGGWFPGIWGRALNTGQAFFTNDCAAGALDGLPRDHVPVDSFLAVPVRMGDAVLGQLCVANSPAGYAAIHLDAVVPLAQMLAVALQRKELEDDRKRSERRFQGLAESAHDVIWRTDLQGRVSYVNPAVRTVLGYEPDEVIGMPIERYMVAESVARVRSWSSAAKASRKRPCQLSEEVGCIHRDGTVVPIEVVAGAEFDDRGRLIGFQGISRDLRERRRVEHARQQSEEQLRSIIANMPVMLKAFDDQGRIVAWNRECEAVTGYSSEEMVGNPEALKLLYPDDLQRKRLARALVSPADYRGWELEVTCKNGRRRTIEWSSIARRHPVPGWRTWGIGVDVTELRQAWEERRMMETQLAHQQRLHALGTLASGVAHEINNPANVILNYARLIMDDAPAGSTMYDDARHIVEESERIARIVKSLHAFTSAGSGRMKTTAVAELVDGVLSMVRSMLDQDAIVLTTDIESSAPPIACQGEEMRQVVLNLVENARDALNARFPHADPNKRLRIEARGLVVSGQPWVRLTVEDRGVGIPEDILARVFDPFFSTKPRAVGTGLGLYIAHRLVTRHGGTIRVESEVASFTRFHVELPAAQVDGLATDILSRASTG